ncbi:hypothetical protein BKA62DRAFT_835106 [Auriculariales sp. MPI-PUGE-AT-0066]|nr:hypothetical protein BKA62DRAFT_835106 [Auriculariales sp. MPI-PUGE-AT-0066]
MSASIDTRSLEPANGSLRPADFTPRERVVEALRSMRCSDAVPELSEMARGSSCLLAFVLAQVGIVLALSTPDPLTLYTSPTTLNASDTVLAGLPVLPGVSHIQVHSGSGSGRTYAHHAITEYIDSTLYVAWSSGMIDEDQMGQQSWIAKGTKASNGTWTFTSPRVVFSSALLSNQTAEQNYTYWCSNDITQRGSQPNAFVKFKSSVYAVIEAVDITCYNSGGSKYTQLVLDRAPMEEHQVPNALCANPLRTKLTTLLNRPDIQPMTNEKLINVGTYLASDGVHSLQEVTHAVWFDDGTNTGKGYWQRFWRDTSSVSSNSLVTWTEFSTSVDGSDWFPAVVQSGTNKIVKTNIPDSNTKTFYGAVTLSSGPATFLVHNPQYYADTRWRQPLSISVAHDRIHFNTDHVIRTNASQSFVADTRGVKRVGLSYPHATVAEDEIIVAYSEDKENIWITRIPLSSLASNTTTSSTTTSSSTSTSSSSLTTPSLGTGYSRT